MADRQPIIIGITGGIGSGKTTVSRIFEFLGIPVYNSDMRAKALMRENVQLVSKIKSLFGEESYSSDGQINNSWIGSQVFQNPELLKRLNEQVHPAVAHDFLQWTHEQSTNNKFLIKEAAILFESGSYKTCDKIILVTAPVEIRIKRVQLRSGLTENEIQKRIQNQWTDELKIPLSHYIIDNKGDTMLIPQVLRVLQSIKNDYQD